ncbi:hypothetical protein TSACC_21881 [Terrimicrobium sacchariphilum]|uniref:Uncharacterized protein n=1 Tax=Terrimicrobium sacchariphilum TaxID=690879 RepID=A0A146G9B1_TERSA|nr:hypothetical protein [Terrimicrobium sacchariphilum]GAT33464.1 hypothetical protein TSACC_21881 [Terrimicrobium sacchariphilum]
MIALRLFVAALAAAVLASCATTTAPRHTGNPPVLAKLEAMGIDSRTYAKIANHRILDFGDILGLLKKGVPSPVILTYIQSTHAPYTLTDDQLNQLMNAGASADLVNYLGKSVGFFEATERSQTGGAGKWKTDPFFADPYYMGVGPFPYAWPDEWYDQNWIAGVF